jgi:uncharacterized metal-binding protein YceD (DUF177 family)
MLGGKLNLLSIKVDEIAEGGLSIEIPGGRPKSDHTKGEGSWWGGNALPLEAHNVIGGRSWQDELLKVISNPYLSFHNGFRGWINLFQSNENIIVKGKIVLTAEMTCSRCNELFDHDLDIEFRSVLTREEVTDKEVELTQKELELTFFSENTIDLGMIITEQISLHLPVKPLCGEGCIGLCGMCGKNRNVKICDCKDKKTDIRFEKLKAFTID